MAGASSTGLGGFGTPGRSGAGNMIHMELDGLGMMTARFRQFQAGVVIAGGLITQRIANDIADTASDLAPFDPDNTSEPHVRSSINVRRAGKGAEVYVNRSGVRDEVPAYLELGTYKMAARPFLKPAGQLVFNAYGIQSAARSVGGLLGPR